MIEGKAFVTIRRDGVEHTMLVDTPDRMPQDEYARYIAYRFKKGFEELARKSDGGANASE